MYVKHLVWYLMCGKDSKNFPHLLRCGERIITAWVPRRGRRDRADPSVAPESLRGGWGGGAGALSLGRLWDPCKTQWAFLVGLGTGLQEMQRRRFPKSGDWNKAWSQKNQSWSAWCWCLDYLKESGVEYKETLLFWLMCLVQSLSPMETVRDHSTELVKNKVWLSYLNTVFLSFNFYWNIGDLQCCVSAEQHSE